MDASHLLAGPALNAESGGLSYRGQTLADLRGHGLPEADVVAAVKAFLSGQVDAMAEAVRAKFITPGSGQAMEYQEVLAQAQMALDASAAGSLDPAKYPMLAASSGIDADPSTKAPATDVLGVARGVQAAHAAWIALGAEIRRVRLSGKSAIDAAATVEAAQSAFSAIAWPSAG